MACSASAMLRFVFLAVSVSLVSSFLAPLPLSPTALSVKSCAPIARAVLPLRHGASLRMSSSGPSPSLDNSDADTKEEEEEAPSTVLSDEDLDARIAELGLGQDGGVEDKSTGETVQLTPIERAQKEAAKIGTTAIGSVANAAITALNAVEQPIDEDEWKKQQGTPKPKEKESGKRTMMDAGVLGVVVPVFLVGGALGFWAIASENNWF